MEFTPASSQLDGSARNHPTRVLTADPDPTVREALDAACGIEGWQTVSAADGAETLEHLRTGRPHVVVTETAMPDVDGMALLSKISAHRPRVPFMVLTRDHGVRYRVECLAAGADDCVAKPFDLDEVMLRLKGILRRGGPEVAPVTPRDTIVVGDLELDESSREVSRDGIAIGLTDTEFRLLRYMMCNPRQVLSKAQILGHVWNHDTGGRESIVELYISYLRRKLDHGSVPRIHTVRGLGYVLRPG